MAAAIAHLYAELDLKNQRFKRGADEVVRDSGRMQKALGGVLSKAKTVAVGVATVGVSVGIAFGVLAKGAITAASDLAETISKTNAVFGANAKEVLKWGQNAEAAVGLSDQAALEAVSTVGNLLKGVGVANKDLPIFSENIIQAAADLGSFNNIDPAQVVEDLRSGLVGEAEPLRKYGILLNEAAVSAKGLELGLADANGELSEGAKVQARYALIMEQMGDAQGDFAKTSGGLANGTRILKANIQGLRAEIGAKLLPIVTKIVAGFNRWFKTFNDFRSKGMGSFKAAVNALQKSLTNVFGAKTATKITAFILTISDFVSTVIATFRDLRKKGLSPLDAALNTIRNTLDKVFGKGAGDAFAATVDRIDEAIRFVAKHIDQIKAVVLTAGKVFISVFGWLIRNLDLLAPIVVGLTTSFLLFYKVIPAIKAARLSLIALRATMLLISPWFFVIAAAVALFYIAYKKNWLGIRDITNKVVAFVVKAFARFMAILRGGKGLHKALEGLPTPIQKIAIALRRVVALVGSFINAWKMGGPIAAFRQLSHDIEKIGRSIANFFASIGMDRFATEIKRTFKDLGKTIRDTVKLVDDVIHGRWEKVWSDAKVVLEDFLQLALDRVRMVGAIFKDVGDLAGSFFRAIGLERYAARAQGLFKATGDMVTHLVDLIDDLIHGRWAAAWKDFQKIAVDMLHIALNGMTLFPSLLLDIFEKVDWGKVATVLWTGIKLAVRYSFFLIPGLILYFIRNTDWGELIADGRRIIGKLYRGAVDFWKETMRPWLASITGRAARAIGAVADALKEKGGGLLKGLYHGALIVWDSTVKPWLAGLPGRVFNAAGDVYGAGKGIGVSLVAGIWNGVVSIWDWLMSQLTKLYNSIPGPLRKVLELASPSKLFMRMGKQTVQGFLIGVEKSMPDLQRTMGRMAATVSLDVPSTRLAPMPAIASGTRVGRGGATTIAGGGFHVNGPITVIANNPQEFAREMIAAKNRRRAGRAA